MKKHKKLITTFAALALMCMMSISAFASTTVYLPSNQAWTSSYSATRTKSYSYAQAKLLSVYPTSGSDNFTKAQVRLVDSNGTRISDSEYVVLKEGDGWKDIEIKEGKLNLGTIYFQFRGNTSSNAYAEVSYTGK